jgi:zinc protease
MLPDLLAPRVLQINLEPKMDKIMKCVAHMRMIFVLIAGLLAFSAGPVIAVEIQQFSTPAGIKVYLVENYTSPIITTSFSFSGGASQDPEGKAGAAHFLSSMLDEGAGEASGQEFQALAEKYGIDLGFSAQRDYFTGSMQTLAENSSEAFRLLHLALNEPRFDARPMERMRQSILRGLKRAKNRPRSIASKAMRAAIFKGHPYARPTRGSIESVSNLTRDDLSTIHRRLMVKKGLVIGVVGAVSKQELGPIIDGVFASLPENSDRKIIADARLEFGSKIEKHLDINQSIVSFAFPGFKRSDPEFFAAYLANHILGGGSFSSRLYDEVREKRGLAYSVYSRLATYSHAAYTLVGSATSTERVDEAIEVMRAELKRMAEEGPTAKELAAAKKYVIGSYAIRNLDTSLKVASVLVAIQQINLGIDYIDRREKIINSVTLEEVKSVAAKLLGNTPTLVIVGPARS